MFPAVLGHRTIAQIYIWIESVQCIEFIEFIDLKSHLHVLNTTNPFNIISNSIEWDGERERARSRVWIRHTIFIYYVSIYIFRYIRCSHNFLSPLFVRMGRLLRNSLLTAIIIISSPSNLIKNSIFTILAML